MWERPRKMIDNRTKQPIETTDDLRAAYEHKSKELTRRLKQIAGYKELVVSLTNRIHELEQQLAAHHRQ